jgi:hypothetical protein
VSSLVPKRNLHHDSDEVKAPRAPSSVQSLGTTANPQSWQGNSEWVADMEYVWRSRTTEPARLLGVRARARRKMAADVLSDHPALAVTLLRSAEWAEHRARALSMGRSDIVATCRKRWRKVACRCGWKDITVGCDAPSLCEWCRKRHWRKWRHRITRSMDAHLRAARGAWNLHRRGMLPGVYLLTLTGPHSGSLEIDRAAMGAAWRRLTKDAHAGRWWGAYALTWEVTPGKDGRGHLHAHVAVVSSWVPYDELHVAWSRAMPGARVLDVQAPNRRRNQAGSAANYLAKYVTKGIDPSVMSGQKAGEMLCAFRGKRKVTTSTHFWKHQLGRCRSCGTAPRAVGAPCSLQEIAPAAVLRSMAERTRYRDDSRFVTQMQLICNSA